MISIDLSGKKAIVCGSSQGIGKAAALRLAEAGAEVTLIARDESKLTEVLKELSTSSGQRHWFLIADFTQPLQLKDVIHDHMKEGRSVNILINNTGGPRAGDAVNADTSEFITAFSNHLICNQILVQATVESMKSSGYGRIINIISTSVKQPLKGLGVSNTIRGAVASWAKTLAGELGPYGITINNVLPGATKTERLYSLFKTKSENTGKSTDEIESEWKKEIPAGRFAEPVELANAVAFLASPLASYINGINLPVDGGRTGCL